ncbi:MarR family winged helix-turn-helix transcriptional regulator [Ulvibacter antarcticus]|uniref:DNA-binding MarR family transcriptional regulator n=1 Tax=Ulvibacter antarcticus TaxID=442714 RepID=A0A3L9Y7Q2_9FLAO|nr:MarR family transcriptional regulator [Ulvibacter antarcticus]RMA56743.1 DNA-binding MarR family transcriptional regulator [Ulvibacter antarcticus]
MIEEVILFQIDKTSKVAKQYSQREFDRLGLEITVEQWILLKIVHESNDISQKELAEKSLRDPASITRTLDLLQKKELINRLPIPENRRQYSIDLSKKGVVFIKTNMPLVDAHRKKSIEGLSEKEQRNLNELLKRIQENMS